MEKTKFWLFLMAGLFLPASAEAIVASSVSEIANAINAANNGGDSTIRISPGIYNLNGTYFRLLADDVTIAGSTGEEDDVVLDGGYITTEIFQIIGSSVTIKDLTLKRAYYHPIHIFPENKDVTGTLIENVHIIDPGQQASKINQNSAKTHSVNNGVVRNSFIELTSSGRAKVWEINGSCYTGGVDAHHAANWLIAMNTIQGFWCAGGLSEHGVHFWSFSDNTSVTRNTIINCDRGIGFGLGSSGHIGGTISNNMIYHDSGHIYSDVGIGLESASDVTVVNNTIYHEHNYPNAIEYRFSSTTGARIYNNLTNRLISSRDGGNASLANNVMDARPEWFISTVMGDLHLAGREPDVVDMGRFLTDLPEDFDGDPRPGGKAFDIGADELGPAGGQNRGFLPSTYLLLN